MEFIAANYPLVLLVPHNQPKVWYASFPACQNNSQRKALPGSMTVKQQMERHSGTGYRLSHFCFISDNDGKDDINLCENATDFYLRFGALP